MALTDGNVSDMVMPVAPMYGGGYGGGFGNNFGGDWAWIILLILLAGGNGWGNGFGGGWGMGGFAADGAMLYPWMNQAELTTGGFRDQAISTGITSIRDGLFDISTQLCNGFAGVNAGVSNGFAQAEIAANGRQMANMNQIFGLSTQFADCCCENRLGIANLGADIAREACATRTTDTANTQAILTAINGGIQSVKDQLCADKIDAKNDEIAQLRQELLYSRGQASQVAQTADIRAGFVQANADLYSLLNNCPIPSTPVYGRQNIFTCGGNCGCGCGNNF